MRKRKYECERVRKIKKVLEMAFSCNLACGFYTKLKKGRKQIWREKGRGNRQMINQGRFCNEKCQGFTFAIIILSRQTYYEYLD